MRNQFMLVNAFLSGAWACAFTWGPTNVGVVLFGVWVAVLGVGWFLLRRRAARSSPAE